MKFSYPIPTGVKRAPLRTFTEMADELGVASHKLVQAFRLHPDGAPTPTFTHRNSGDTGRKTWYNRADFIKWWKSFNPDA